MTSLLLTDVIFISNMFVDIIKVFIL